MIVEYIRYKIPPTEQVKFIADYQAASKSLDSSEYCLGYEVAQCEEDPDFFILRIQWTSTEDHMNKFRSSEAFRNFLPHIRPYIDNIEEMRHYNLTRVTS